MSEINKVTSFGDSAVKRICCLVSYILRWVDGYYKIVDRTENQSLIKMVAAFASS